MTAPTYLESLRGALHSLMQGHPEVVVIGEDIRDPYGGAFKVTHGLSTSFPGRVFTAPISEAAIVGVSTGMAMRGLRPIAEIMFGDFLTLAADQLINSASKFPLMYRDKVAVPMVVRTPMGGGRGYGPTHSQSLEKHFLGVPGLTVVCPSIAHDAGALLQNAALCSRQPVLFIEYKNLYALRQVESNGGLYVRAATGSGAWPAMVVENFAEGAPDVVVVAYGGVSAHVVGAMAKLVDEEIRVRSVFPSLLSAAPDVAFDRGELLTECPILIAEESTQGFNWGSEISASLHELGVVGARIIRRISSRADVVPASKRLEDEMLVTENKLYHEIIEALS